MSKIDKISSFVVLAIVSIALTFGVVGCQKNGTQDTSSQSQPVQTDQSQDPAGAANLAPVEATQAPSTNNQPANQASQQNYQQPAPDQNYSNADYDAGEEDTSYGQPVLEATQPPPPLPEYSQPDCPGDGYLWTPGYWSYAPQGYYWVPGAWARPPQVGFLWTPGYWGFVGGRYRYNYGFWGRHIGYYGGINYGFGYVGVGYQGGYWNGDRFNYNRSVNNVNITNVQVYNRTVTNTVIVNNTTVNITNNRSSYNGPGGITRRPLPTEVAATREQRIPPMTTQLQQRQSAAQNRQQFASVNQGRPAVLAATKPIPEGKPIAPVIPARPAPAARPAQPNRSQPQTPVTQPKPQVQTQPAPQQQQTRPAPQQSAPKAEAKPATPQTQRQATRPAAPEAKPKTPPPPPKKQPPSEKDKQK